MDHDFKVNNDTLFKIYGNFGKMATLITNPLRNVLIHLLSTLSSDPVPHSIPPDREGPFYRTIIK